MTILPENVLFVEQVGNSELYGHRAVLASASPHLMELFSVDDESKGNVRENVVTYHLNGGFDKKALEKLIDYAYTARWVTWKTILFWVAWFWQMKHEFIVNCELFLLYCLKYW